MKQTVRPFRPVAPCWECSKRRLVCDLGTPKCRKCGVRGVDCPGYQHKPLQWMRPGQTRSKGAQSMKTLGLSCFLARSDGVIANCTILGQGNSTQVKASEDSKVEDASSTPAYNINIAPDLSGIRLGRAVTPFIVPSSYVSCIPPAIAQTLICSALGHRILQTAEGFERERSAMALNLRQCRGKALQLVRKELTGGCDSIMPIICLLLSEDLFSDGTLTCIPCAPDLLTEVIHINYYRFLKDCATALLSNSANQLPRGSDILRRILDFSPKLWASEIVAHSNFSTGGSLDKTEQVFAVQRIGWERVGRIYQSAVVLYCLASQPQVSDHVRESDQWMSLRACLLQDLRDLSLDACCHHRKLVIWPLTILGLTLNYDDDGAQQFVLQELKWASASLGTATPLVAMQLLERTWQAYSGWRWDKLFDRPYIFVL
ncbi:unnamed protein product [Fusarium equiseti]|uniref:Zn(2)-C6 fungal-type domain-containing protein n=1 Tax=Fusarium equiseti TaxID=61235 RepID=A0A8J2IHJ2_FUSEQ|nr:unnamed protein product [Fusarium equiseti]